MVVEQVAGSPILSKDLVNQRTWVVAHVNAMYPALYPASTVDSATVSCLLLFQNTGLPATKNILHSIDKYTQSNTLVCKQLRLIMLKFSPFITI